VNKNKIIVLCVLLVILLAAVIMPLICKPGRTLYTDKRPGELKVWFFAMRVTS